MKIVTIPDLHSRKEHLPALAGALNAADLVILPGDITVGGRQLDAIIDFIRQHCDHVLAVPGNMDDPATAQYFTEHGMNLHAQHRIIEGVAFIGLGGALPFFGNFAYSEDDFTRFIKQATDGLDMTLPQVLISHQPPHNTINDLARGKHVGSKAIRHYIETHQPLLCLTGHIHEGRGIDTIGTTQVVNPGPLWRDGGYVHTEIVQGKIESLTIRHS